MPQTKEYVIKTAGSSGGKYIYLTKRNNWKLRYSLEGTYIFRDRETAESIRPLAGKNARILEI